MAPKEVRADPIEICRLADTMLHSSEEIDDSWRLQQAALAVPTDAFGDSSGAAGIHKAHESVADDADVTLGRLVAVLQGDMDRLYQIAFAYQKTDEDEARKYHPPHRYGPI